MLLRITLAATLIFTACTKSDPHRIAFPSPLKFTYDASLSTGPNIAKVDGEEITVSQLYSPSAALQELEQRINLAVFKAACKKADSLESGKIVFGFEAPDEKLAKTFSCQWNKGVEVSFDANSSVAADINGEKLTRAQVAADDMLLSRLMADSFQQKMQALEGIISRRKILQASKAVNQPMEEFIKEKVLQGGVQVSDQDVINYATKNNITEKELTDELKAQLKDTIIGRERDRRIADYVGKNLVKSPIQIGFEKPQVRMTMPAVGDAAPKKGQGPINITLFSFVQCEDCKAITKAMKDFVEDNTKYYQLSYVFNFPENNNEERMVAEAALCLKKQNENYFWGFPEQLQENTEVPLEERINNAAKSLGSNFEEFRACFLAREFKDAVDSHLQGTRSLGFYKTPVVVLDGLVYETPVSQELVEKAQSIKAERGLGFNLFYKLKKWFAGE